MLRALKLIALGAAMSGVSAWPAAAQFTNIAESAGVAVENARGAAFADYDNDGCVDLLVTTRQGSRLFRNVCDGTGRFIDVSRDAGVLNPRDGWGAAWADFDNDGDLDVYITAGTTQFSAAGPGGGSPNVLYENLGNGKFKDIAGFSGIDDSAASTGAAWGDYDNDGDLDLFVANRFENSIEPDILDRLYRNDGNGLFVNVAGPAGVSNKLFRRTFMAVWVDYDKNGMQDLYLAVDFGDDVLYRNNGDGTFTNVSREAGVKGPEHGMGIAVGDINADGCIDIFSTNNTEKDDEEHGPSVLYLNNCDGTFQDIAPRVGVLDRAVVEWGPNFVDWDNDADLDLAVTAGGMLSNGQPNALYEMQCAADGCGFVDVTQEYLVDEQGAAFGSAWADIDNDGDLDWFVANSKGGPSALFRNDNQVGNWLKVRLVGRQSNARGVGATVELVSGGRSQFATIRSGTGFASDEEQIAFFGMGAIKKADAIRVTWPSGQVSDFQGVGANQWIVIVEGEADFRAARR